MAGLLVSVRSADEARAALGGGAAVIDVKEPDRGPLGRADREVWQAVRAAVPDTIPVSVALGELDEVVDLSASSCEGIFSYQKLGLARCGPDWRERWARYRRQAATGASWIAVAYADWQEAGSPHPADVLDEARSSGCAGILLDTWNKARSGINSVDTLRDWVARARRVGLLVSLAGGLDVAGIVRLAPLRPDLFAVRGAACCGGSRHARIDPVRVARLVAAAAVEAP